MNIPGGMAWHGPLALLAPGLWLVLQGGVAAVAPPGRGRWVLAAASAGVAALLALLGLRAAWAMESWRIELIDGQVHGGLPWLLLGQGAALWMARRLPGPAPRRLAAAGAAFLLPLLGPWWLQLPLGLALATWPRRLPAWGPALRGAGAALAVAGLLSLAAVVVP